MGTPQSWTRRWRSFRPTRRSDRRATASKQYLVSHGIDGSRIETVSYGEERPIAQGHDEDAWAQNRRDEFEVLSGGESLKQP